MTPPKRPTKNPKPIGRHPHAGQLSIVATFRLPRPTHRLTVEDLRNHVELVLGQQFEDAEDLTVQVRILGAGGEASEMEGIVGPLAHTEDDLDTIRTARDQDTINPTWGRL